MTVRHRGQRILLTGDMELADPTSRTARIEQGLLTLEGRIPKQRPFAVVKVPHHGSPQRAGSGGPRRSGGPGDSGQRCDLLRDHHRPGQRRPSRSRRVERYPCSLPGAAWARTDRNGQTTLVLDRDADPPAARRHDAAGAAVGAGWARKDFERLDVRTCWRSAIPIPSGSMSDFSAASHSRMGSLPRSRQCPGPCRFPRSWSPRCWSNVVCLQPEFGRPAMPNHWSSPPSSVGGRRSQLGRQPARSGSGTSPSRASNSSHSSRCGGRPALGEISPLLR